MKDRKFYVVYNEFTNNPESSRGGAGYINLYRTPQGAKSLRTKRDKEGKITYSKKSIEGTINRLEKAIKEAKEKKLESGNNHISYRENQLKENKFLYEEFKSGKIPTNVYSIYTIDGETKTLIPYMDVNGVINAK